MKKQELTKMRRGLGTSRTSLNIPTSKSQRCQKRKSTLKLIRKNNEGKLLQSGEGNRLSGSPTSSENPKEVEPKEKHTKAHHNYIT